MEQMEQMEQMEHNYGCDEQGKDLDIYEKRRERYDIMRACESGDVEKVRALIMGGLYINDYYGSCNETLLCVAVRYNYIDMVHMLLIMGADVNRRCGIGTKDNGESCFFMPLEGACCRGYVNLAKILLDAGADVDGKYADEYGSGYDVPIISACMMHRTETVELLISYKANIELKCKHSEYTPLIISSKHGHLEAVKILLAHGANKEARDAYGDTAFIASCLYGIDNVDIMKILIDNGCDKNAVNNEGNSALHIACRLGCINCVKYLISIGLNTDLVNSEQMTPIQLATTHRKRASDECIERQRQIAEILYLNQMTLHDKEDLSN